MPAEIHADDLSPEQRKKLGIKKPRASKFTADDVRGWALRVLGSMAQLSREERARVLRHAERVNRV